MIAVDPNGRAAALQVNADGELIVTGTGGGGGGGGDASAANQDEQTAILATLASQTDGVEGSLASLDSKASTAATSNSARAASLASIDTKTPALGQALAAASVPVVLTAAQITTLTPVAGLTDAQLRATPVPVTGSFGSGTPARIRTTLTRPNDTNAYTGGDAIANATSGASVLTFTNVALANGGSFRLNRILVHGSAIPSVVNLDLALALFDVSPSASNDNAPIAFSNTDNLRIVGIYPLLGQTSVMSLDVAGSGINGEHILKSDTLDELLICDAASRNLYGQVWVLNASGYTPIASEAFTFDLIGTQQ